MRDLHAATVLLQGWFVLYFTEQVAFGVATKDFKNVLMRDVQRGAPQMFVFSSEIKCSSDQNKISRDSRTKYFGIRTLIVKI